MDQTGDGQFTDRGGLDPKNPNVVRSGDTLVLDFSNPETLSPERQPGESNDRVDVSLPQYLVLDTGTYKVNVEQSAAGISLDLVPVKLPAGTVELGEVAGQQGRNLYLTGEKTSVVLREYPAKIVLPADTYSTDRDGESPYPVEAEEGVTAGRPFPEPKKIMVSVVQPDGSPAAGADVVVAGKGQIIEIRGNAFPREHGYKPVRLGEGGRLPVRTDLEGYEVFVLHPSGFGQVAKAKVEKDARVVLEPWATIEGTLKIGSKPGAREKVGLRWRERSDDGDVEANWSTVCDENGRFRIEKVVPRRLEASWVQEWKRRGEVFIQPKYVTPKPAKTTAIAIGGTGRALVGRIIAEGSGESFLLTEPPYGWLTLPDTLPPLEFPANWVEMTREQTDNVRKQNQKQWMLWEKSLSTPHDVAAIDPDREPALPHRGRAGWYLPTRGPLQSAYQRRLKDGQQAAQEHRHPRDARRAERRTAGRRGSSGASAQARSLSVILPRCWN